MIEAFSLIKDCSDIKKVEEAFLAKYVSFGIQPDGFALIVFDMPDGSKIVGKINLESLVRACMCLNIIYSDMNYRPKDENKIN
jgi:hypothetical protein